MIRGGIAYGRYWEEKANGNICVVSDALVRAVRLESTVRVPAVAVSPEVNIELSIWAARFAYGQFVTPLLHFGGHNIVNPFNRYWFASARTRVCQLRGRFPQHEEKYKWFIELSDAVERDDILVPQAALDEMLRVGILHERTNVHEPPSPDIS